MEVIKNVWQKYDKDGTGYLSQEEARHFIEKYCKDRHNIKDIPERAFQEWYKELNRHGNGQIKIIDMANYLKVLVHKIHHVVQQRSKLGYMKPPLAANRQHCVTVGDIINGEA